MRAVVAKSIRNSIYGDGFSPKFRQYKIDGNGTIHSDIRRKQYQNAKDRHVKGFGVRNTRVVRRLSVHQ